MRKLFTWAIPVLLIASSLPAGTAGAAATATLSCPPLGVPPNRDAVDRTATRGAIFYAQPGFDCPQNGTLAVGERVDAFCYHDNDGRRWTFAQRRTTPATRGWVSGGALNGGGSTVPCF
ncbi:hypothetical protein [Kibdelosporangium phytohabitans]|uniref:SH3b domain-containing protein n=1 Tax=Kibdelosporangium phytohabitans TaxID=860235 RepID=A0A0N9HX34_9PSEU|nr:hypothetical protein [Kibdelosporangium phytohabitans]ALG07771.1 hypothetical protein AOZ06_13395 [Kibdelosporangium phytohabitans]MBE1471315.1 hypothetical protein [Kibdelosporangium phytohabitans]